jgi:hypothetical protein
MCTWGIPSALANAPCKAQRATSALPDHEKSRFVARALIANIEKTWEIVARDKPEAVSVSLVDDPSGNGAEIEFHKVQFKNFEAGYFRNEDGVVMRAELTTTSTKFDLPCGLRIGQSQAQVLALFGPPSSLQPGSFVYGTGGDQNGEVILSFANGKLRQATWMYDTH